MAIQQTQQEQHEKRARLTLDIPPALHFRLKVLAAQQHLSMRDVAEQILEEALPDVETLLTQSRLDESALRPVTQAALDQLAAVRKQVMAGRELLPGDSADLLHEERDEYEARADERAQMGRDSSA